MHKVGILKLKDIKSDEAGSLVLSLGTIKPGILSMVDNRIEAQ